MSARDRQSRALWFALVANGIFLVVEFVGGLVFNSLALLADAAHMLSDVAGLSVALVAHVLSSRPASGRHTYGLRRLEVLGAQANGVVLVGTSIWITVEAVGRIGADAEVDGAGLLVVASLGLAVNIVSAVILRRAEDGSLNMRGAFLHMAADGAGSVGAVLAGVVIIAGGPTGVDAIVSILIAALVLWAAWGLLRDATHVLLEGTPGGLDPGDVEQAMAGVAGVSGVHHLHVWSLGSTEAALSAHLTIEGDEGEVSLHDAQETASAVRTLLHDRFGIEHATLEVECHPCD